MGLTIHFDLRLAAADTARARSVIERAAKIATELKLGVGPIRQAARATVETDEASRWLDSGVRRDEHFQPIQHADELVGVVVSPGEGCESAMIALARFPDETSWEWSTFCKTGYAANKEYGGVPNFVRCHAGLCMLLAAIQKLGVKVTVDDEAGYWTHRDRKKLAAMMRDPFADDD